MKTAPELIRLNRLCRLESDYYLSRIDLVAASNFLRPELANLKNYSVHRSMEGLLGKRPYAGTRYLDRLESVGVESAKRIFGAEMVNIQPHSGSQANQAAYAAFLSPGDTVLAMKFDSGGHLTHGNPVNFSGRIYHFENYTVDPVTGLVNYETILEIARRLKPKLIVAGASSYPRVLDHAEFSRIARETGALLMVDIAHPAGLIAAGLYPNPVPYADVVTGSLEKTFWGPHGGIIMSKAINEKVINKAVHPGTQSSIPIDRIIQISKAMLFAETDEFKKYAAGILENAKVLERYFTEIKGCLRFGGTDSHFVVIDVWHPFGLTGKEAENILENIGIFTNRQVIPDDPKPVYEASGLRIGTPAATGRGYTKQDFEVLTEIIGTALLHPGDKSVQSKLKHGVDLLVRKKRPLDPFRTML